MKLAVVIPGFQSDKDDWCIPAFTNLARELSHRHEVHIFALRYPHRRAQYQIGEVYVHALGGATWLNRRIARLGSAALWVRTLREVRQEHRVAPFSSVLGIWATESGWLATHAAGLCGVPSVVHLAGGELAHIPEIGYGNRLEATAGKMVAATLRRSTALTVPSTAVLNLLAEHYPRAAEKATLLPLGVDTVMFSVDGTRQTESAPFTFIAVGSLIPVKGHDLLLDAFSKLIAWQPKISCRLAIAGSGPLLPQLQAKVLGLGLKGYVTFLSEVLHDQLPTVYRQADCFVLTSWHEAECMALLEGMACGLPWVGLPTGAISDLAPLGRGSGRGGIVVRSRDADTLAGAMWRIISFSTAEREALGREARRAVSDLYGLHTQTEKLCALLNPLTGGTSGC